jgi:isoleucyl-tRNA synthetase
MAFPPLPDLAPDQLERAQLDRWKEEDLFRRTLEANREGPPYVFYEGPPTANGRPGIHHVFARTIKDLICRFHAMQGQSVTRIAGWDTHGLPVEIEVEKELRLNGKREIEEYGVREFNARARQSVFKYQGEWESLSDRIGYWLDYEHPYVTFTNDYVESVWWLLARLHQRDLLYRGHRVLPYCPRCGTVLSSHELAQGYEGRHHQLGLRHVSAGRRLRPGAVGVDHDAVDPALQRRGRGASRAGVRGVRGGRTHADPGDRASRPGQRR